MAAIFMIFIGIPPSGTVLLLVLNRTFASLQLNVTEFSSLASAKHGICPACLVAEQSSTGVACFSSSSAIRFELALLNDPVAAVHAEP